MANAIHHAFALDDEAHIEIGDENAFPRGQRRNDMRAFRRDDRRHATTAETTPHLFIRRYFCDLLLAQPTRRVDDETAAFERMMTDGDFDLIGEDLPDQ